MVAELLNVKLNDENLTATSEKDNDLWQSSFNHSQKYSEPKLKSTTKVCKCSFCGKSESQVEKLVAGSNNVCICGKCTKLCLEVLEDTVNPKI
ncbi:MAG: hypothetical protein IKZ58_05300 [Selenomonadaceae bacterium]|nr:hypothetical protein [Selenomonadaceae bacterium]